MSEQNQAARQLTKRQYYRAWYRARKWADGYLEDVMYTWMTVLVVLITFSGLAIRDLEKYGIGAICDSIVQNGLDRTYALYPGVDIVAGFFLALALALVLMLSVIRICVYRDWREWLKQHPYDAAKFYDDDYFTEQEEDS